KSNVLSQLPERLDKNFFVPMTPQQRELHDENREIVVRIVMKWRKYKFLSEADQRRLMIALQTIRMSCESTYLLDKTTPHVVNVVAKGTIEEGMLGVLKFKKSLFAGVLDGGEKEVFLGGSRLTKFMETVEKTTGDIPQAEQQAEPAKAEPRQSRDQSALAKL